MRPVNLKKSVIWFIGFLVFSGLVRHIDVQPIGPEGSTVGFATINKAVWDAIGVHLQFYSLTQYCGIVAIGIAFCFALLGLDQLIKRKSLHYVDSRIIALGFYYIIVMAFYALFMFVAINYRPVILEGEGLESSYPSSHTMLGVTVTVAFMIYNNFFKNVNKKIDRILFTTVSWLFIALMVIGRLVSGVHWFTDIIGSILLSMSIIEIYIPLCNLVQNIHDKIEAKKTK